MKSAKDIKFIGKALLVAIMFCIVGNNRVVAQERVYISTDKEYYLAGENIWCSLYCMEGKELSGLSSVAYVEFYSKEGLAATYKVALVEGRGAAKINIPFSFATGNYSMVAYTKRYGGNSTDKFNGKIVSIFNTLTNERVKDGVEVCEELDNIGGKANITTGKEISVEVPKRVSDDKAGLKLHNLSDENISLNISVYENGGLDYMLGSNVYNKSLLMERTGNFEPVDDVDYEGETIRGRVILKAAGENAANSSVAHKNVYLSSIGGDNDIYSSVSDSSGNIVFYTNNIYGNREMVLDVADGLAGSQNKKENDQNAIFGVELLEHKYKHTPADIPVLKMSRQIQKDLKTRGINMQISKRFDADTLYDLSVIRRNPLLGNVTPIVYRLDDYTRFPTMREVVREYVSRLRIRELRNDVEFQVVRESGFGLKEFARGRGFILLDGVPIREHALVANIDPLLVEEILIYPRQYAIGGYTYEGIVLFKTYKGDLGGVKLSKDISIINYKGVEYPLAFSGNQLYKNEKYPNYNSTIYWNPVVTLHSGKTFEFDCVLPQYKGEFKVVVEGITESGKSIYYTTEFTNK